MTSAPPLPPGARRGGFDERLPIAIVILGLAIIPPVCVALDDPFFIRLFLRAINLAIAAVALNLVLGFGGMVSLLHAGFMGLAGYIVAILAYHEVNGEPLLSWPFIIPGTANIAVSMPLAILATTLFALAAGAISIRTKGIYFIMITLAFNQMLFYLAVALEKYGGQDGLQILSEMHAAGLPLPRQIGFYYICLAALALVLLLTHQIVRSRFGAVLVALRQNERRAAALGVNAYPYHLTALAISGALAGLAGALFALGQKFISPADLAWLRSGDIVIMAALGGITTVWGPVLGAVAFVVLELLLSSWTVHWLVLFGAFIIAVTLFLRKGLAELLELLLDRMRGCKRG
jgi:branched-chain amino acid transport system permease protein